MNWHRGLKIKRKYPLKDKVSFRIAGEAEFFSDVGNVGELSLLVRKAYENKIPIFILGAGSNLLISDKGVKGLVIKLTAPEFRGISIKGNYFKIGSAVMLSKIIQYAKDNSMSGIEFLAGIPGTLGGALMMNAGSWGKEIGDLVCEIEVMDLRGKLKVLEKDRIAFGYRKSSLEKYIVLSALLKLKKGNKKKISKRIKEYILRKHQSQDLTFPNAGCIFKNPQFHSAGELIDLCALKGKSIGQAFISEKHANFFLNEGNAKASDILSLMQLAKKAVRKRFKLNLEPEIKIWG